MTSEQFRSTGRAELLESGKIKPSQMTSLDQIVGAVDDEISSNMRVIDKVRGKEVLFGATIILQHARSNKYVTIYKDRANVDQNALAVKLESKATGNAYLDLLPGYSNLKTGDRIYFGTPISIKSLKHSKGGDNLYVHVSGPDKPSNKPIPHVKRHELIESSWEVNCKGSSGSESDMTIFNITPFQYAEVQGTQASPSICACDIVAVYHASMNAYLTLQYQTDGEGNKTPCIAFEGITDPSLSSRALWNLQSPVPYCHEGGQPLVAWGPKDDDGVNRGHSSLSLTKK